MGPRAGHHQLPDRQEEEMILRGNEDVAPPNMFRTSGRCGGSCSAPPVAVAGFWRSALFAGGAPDRAAAAEQTAAGAPGGRADHPRLSADEPGLLLEVQAGAGREAEGRAASCLAWRDQGRQADIFNAEFDGVVGNPEGKVTSSNSTTTIAATANAPSRTCSALMGPTPSCVSC